MPGLNVIDNIVTLLHIDLSNVGAVVPNLKCDRQLEHNS